MASSSDPGQGGPGGATTAKVWEAPRRLEDPENNMGIMEKKMETTFIYRFYRGCMGIMEKKMETTIRYRLYRGYIGMMEKKMETTIMGSLIFA